MEKKSLWKRVFCSHPAYRTLSKEAIGRFQRQFYDGHPVGRTYTKYIYKEQCVCCGHEVITIKKIFDN